MAVRIIDLLEIVEVDKQEREWAHGTECQRAELNQCFLEMGVIVEAGQTVADGLITQELIGLHQVSIGVGEFLDESFGLYLLAFDRRNVGDRLDDMRVPGCRLDLRPLDEQVLVIREWHLAGRRLSGLNSFRHLAERTRRGTAGDLFVARAVRDIAEFILRNLILKHNLVRGGIDNRDDHRLRVQQHLWVVLWSFWGERHRRANEM